MSIHDFSGLLRAALEQPEPQRLLLVFAAAELPGDASTEETASFQRGEGGALAPVVCVDKLPGEIDSFAALLDESQRTGVAWHILFVASLPGRAGLAPNADEAVQPLRMMVEAIKDGRIDGLIAVTREGKLVRLR